MDSQFIIEQYSNFQSKLKSRQKIKIALDPRFEAELDMMEYVILSKYEKNAKTLFKDKKNKDCGKPFKRGFKELVDIEKIYYYNMIITHLENIANQDFAAPKKQQGSISSPGYSKTHSKIGWKQVRLKIDFDKRYLYVQRDHKLKAYDLNFYLIRKSKATQYNSFVLEAINQVINEKGCQVHVGFKDVKIFRQWYDGMKKLVEYVFWEKIKNMIFAPEVVEMFETKAHDQDIKDEKTVDELVEKLCQSTFTTSQKIIEQEEDRMTKSVTKIYSGRESQQSQKSLDKSCRSIEIKSHSPRSSLKERQVEVLKDQSEDEGSETFRSFVELAREDIQDFDDEQSPIFRKLMPEYSLQTIQTLISENQLVYSSQDSKIKIYSNTADSKRVKVFVQFDKNVLAVPFQKFAALLWTPEFLKQVNSQIQELNTKTTLTSDNCAILYQKNKCYNRLYRSRDFVFIRHQFRKANKIYVLDKSVEDVNIPPFTTIVRGELTIVYEIEEADGVMKLTIDAKVQNFGYLKDLQELNINIKLFKGFEEFQTKCKKIEIQNLSPLFEQIIKKQSPNLQNKSQSENIDSQKQDSSQIVSEQDKPSNKQSIEVTNSEVQEQSKTTHIQGLPIQSIKGEDFSTDEFEQRQRIAENIDEIAQSVEKMQFEGQISMVIEPKQFIQAKIVRKFDHQGKVIIEEEYMWKKHQVFPEPADKKEFVFLKNPKNEHSIWKGNWEFLEEGGFKFINKKQIEDQKNVLKFILSQVAKNLVSGKSILNISLPVDIFSSDSNLQKFIFSMGYAPYILQRAAKMNQLDRFLYTVVFGMTNSPLYLQMQKPFNPIIGETFQCYINGCPAYGQQISHHPPIAAFMLVGRGYRVSAQIESKMKLNINSGTGSNSGVYRIKYNDGEEICYICPSGEVSGLAYGDRKFNMIGKAYGWSQKSGLFLQIVFNPKKGGFFDKQSTPIDYVQGRVCQVKQTFIKSFIKSGYSMTPKKTDIIKQHGKFHGRWNKFMKYEDTQLFSYDTDLPLQLEYEKSPLPSDSNWREDITYRRLQKITVAQTWKEKLEIQQRNQRKLREKYRK